MPKSWTGSLTTPGDMEMDSSSESDESSDLDYRSIGIVAIGSLHLPSRLAIVPEETFESLGQRLSNSEKTLIALVPIFGPYPFFRYPYRDEVISSSVRRVWIMEKNEDTFILVVRTPDDDVVVPISTLGMDDKIQMIDVVTNNIATYGYSPISVTDYTGALNIQHWTIAGLKLIFLGVRPTIGFVDTTSGAFEFCLEFKDYDSVVKPLRFLMERAEALVQRASRIGKKALQLIHLARAIIHLIICAQEVFLESASLDSADYCTDLHKLLDDLQDSIDSPTYDLESIFRNLCEDRPGASAIRRSYKAFLELGASDSPRCEQLHAPLGSPSTAGLDDRTRLPQNVNREEFKPIEASLSAQPIGAWLSNTTVPTRDERQLRTIQAPKSLIRDDRKKPRPYRQDNPSNTGVSRNELYLQFGVDLSIFLGSLSAVAWTSPYEFSWNGLSVRQQYDDFFPGMSMPNVTLPEMPLEPLWLPNRGQSTTTSFPSTSAGGGTSQNPLSATTTTRPLLQPPQPQSYPPVQSHALPVSPIEVTLQHLRDSLSRQSWVRNQEPEPVMQEDDPLVQMRLVEPGMSRFEAFIAWDGEKEVCLFPGCESSRGSGNPYSTDRRPRAIAHVYGHFGYKPVTCAGACGKPTCLNKLQASPSFSFSHAPTTCLRMANITEELMNLSEDIPNLSKDIIRLTTQPVFDGTYSKVYRGECHGQAVAVKVLKTISRINVMNRKIRRERVIWGALDHPNILPLIGYAEGDERLEPFGGLVSRWCFYGDVARFLEQHGTTLTLDQKAALWKGIVEGVDYLHNFNPIVVHGDLKPANILLDENGNPRICDFGLARLMLEECGSGMTTTTAHTGTERYLAYELVASNDIVMPTVESDIHALGCIGLDVIFLRSPYSDRKNNARGHIFFDIRQGAPPAVHPGDLKDTEEEFWNIISSCWNRNPTERPRTVELLLALHSIMKSVPSDDINASLRSKITALSETSNERVEVQPVVDLIEGTPLSGARSVPSNENRSTQGERSPDTDIQLDNTTHGYHLPNTTASQLPLTIDHEEKAPDGLAAGLVLPSMSNSMKRKKVPEESDTAMRQVMNLLEPTGNSQEGSDEMSPNEGRLRGRNPTPLRLPTKDWHPTEESIPTKEDRQEFATRLKLLDKDHRSIVVDYGGNTFWTQRLVLERILTYHETKGEWPMMVVRTGMGRAYERVHYAECSICGRGKDSQELKVQHIAKHLISDEWKIKPWRCMFCSTAYSSNDGSHKSHMKRIHNKEHRDPYIKKGGVPQSTSTSSIHGIAPASTAPRDVRAWREDSPDQGVAQLLPADTIPTDHYNTAPTTPLPPPEPQQRLPTPGSPDPITTVPSPASRVPPPSPAGSPDSESPLNAKSTIGVTFGPLKPHPSLPHRLGVFQAVAISTNAAISITPHSRSDRRNASII
ncbi:hypothetical protein FRC17_011189 [Serendipita sp. 399]|nr:hypothetical protein FRC17_011189 [Serendipita sp. 399]